MFLVWLACAKTPGPGDGTEVTETTPVTASCAPVEEVCNGADDDCDGRIDDDLTSSFYADVDGDGFGDPMVRVEDCEAPSDYVADATDCDDHDPTRYPDAPEACDDVDDDCDGRVDEDLTFERYVDADLDGYGDPDEPVDTCLDSPGLSADGTDCDDTDPEIHPTADETCDGEDDDCDGLIDEDAVDALPFYADGDGDGYGTGGVLGAACDPPSGTAVLAGDCDDADWGINPGIFDTCDGLDQNCDGVPDDDHRDGWMLFTQFDGRYWEVDLGTAALTEIGPAGGIGDLSSIDVQQSGLAWGFDTYTFSLVTFDPCAGTASTIGNPGHGHTGGIAFVHDELYGIPAAWDELVQYDRADASATVIGALGLDLESSAMAYDCSTDTLYGMNSYEGTLFEIDVATGLATNILDLGWPMEGSGLEYDDDTGTLLLSDLEVLWRVDPATGAMTAIGSLPAWGYDNLAFHPRCE